MTGLVNYIKVIFNVLPNILRGAKLISYLNAIINGGLKKTNDDFEGLTKLSNDKIIFNNQKIYLTKYLNDNFDPTLKRIYITFTHYTELYMTTQYEWDSVMIHLRPQQVLFFNQSENSIYDPIFFSQPEMVNAGIFTIHMPNTLAVKEAQIKKNIDIFNYITKTYIITYF